MGTRRGHDRPGSGRTSPRPWRERHGGGDGRRHRRVVDARVAIDPNGVAGPTGRSADGNPSTRRTEEIAAAVGSAIDAALAGWHHPRVVAIVVGLAGLDESRRSELEGTIRTVARSHGVDVEPLLRTDAEIAFAAGSASPDGLVVIAGTGAIAARILDRRQVATVDGNGWRLGDAGSGYWLGAEVLRRVLESLDGRRPPTAAVLIGAGKVELHAQRAAGSLVEEAVVDLSELCNVIGRSDRRDRKVTLSAEVLDLVRRQLDGRFG